MKIGFIVHGFPVLSETFVLDEVTGLLDLGHEVDILSFHDPGEAVAHREVEGYALRSRIRVLKVPHRRLPRMLRALGHLWRASPRERRVLARCLDPLRYGRRGATAWWLECVVPLLGQSYDVLHAHFGPNGNFGALAKEVGAHRGKLVTTFHSYDIRRGREQGPELYARLRAQGDCFIAISDYNRAELEGLGFDPGRIADLRVGIPLDRFPFRPVQPEAGATRDFRILSVARLHPVKGIADGIRAVAELLRRRPGQRIRYDVVGDGVEALELRRLTGSLGLESVVHFHGSRPRAGVAAAMGEADLYLLPSLVEALPVVVMEALATGLPVVATEVGGVGELVEDGRSGFVVPVGDTRAAASRIERLIDHPELRAELGRRGRERVEERHDGSRSIRRLADLYTSLLARPSP